MASTRRNRTELQPLWVYHKIYRLYTRSTSELITHWVVKFKLIWLRFNIIKELITFVVFYTPLPSPKQTMYRGYIVIPLAVHLSGCPSKQHVRSISSISINLDLNVSHTKFRWIGQRSRLQGHLLQITSWQCWCLSKDWSSSSTKIRYGWT